MIFKFFGKKKKTEQKPLFQLKRSWFSRVRELFTGPTLDFDALKELEIVLIEADLGLDLTKRLIHDLQQSVEKNPVKDASGLQERLRSLMSDYLIDHDESDVGIDKPEMILMVGVNGVGKTTTIAKLAQRYQSQGRQVMLSAGDTFRAAAIEQLQAWGQRLNVPVIAQSHGADAAAVSFDALSSAKAKHMDLLIADTAGRMHQNDQLMAELEKVVRVVKKQDASAPKHIWLVLDATVGQNGLVQAKVFHEALNLSGIILTKLDGTAKGGIIFNICQTLQLPIRYIGLGERAEDLIPFDKNAFIDQLFSTESA